MRLMEHPRMHWFWLLLIRSPLPEPAYYWLLDRLTNNDRWRPLNHREGPVTRCPAPARTEWGTIRCVVARDRCTYAGHRRWDRVLWLMALVWRIRPWWPNAKGRAADKAGRGRALLHEMDRDTTGGAA